MDNYNDIRPYDRMDSQDSTLRRRRSPSTALDRVGNDGQGNSRYEMRDDRDRYDDYDKREIDNYDRDNYDNYDDNDIKKPPLNDDMGGMNTPFIDVTQAPEQNRDIYVRPTRRPTFSSRCQLCWLVIFNIIIGFGWVF